MTRVLLLVVALVALACATRVSMEVDSFVPPFWNAESRVADETYVRLTFALNLRNVAELERIALEVSTPSHANYGNYLTLSEVDALTAPVAADVDLLVSWLRASVADEELELSRAASFVTARMPVRRAEALLACEFFSFRYMGTAETRIRSATHYSLPAEIAPLVAFVGGVRQFERPQKRAVEVAGSRVSEAKDVDFSLVVDPTLLQTRYGTTGVSSKSANNSQSVVQFIGQYYDSYDLQEFFLLFAREALGQTPVTIGPDGYLPGIEASLDIEYIMSMGLGVPTTFWSMPNNNATNEDPFLDWLLAVGNTTSAPLVFSVSYGGSEYGNPVAYLDRINNEFTKQAARGISVLFASGDSGVACTPDGKHYSPDFPASSPWVTAVGGTTCDLSTASSPETVNALSGGGFSNVFSQPPYQSAAVAGYFASHVKLPEPQYYNASGRGYPDVAALSSSYIIVIGLLPEPGVGGTSCASPVTAGVIALLNDLQLAAGKKPLGFLNPWLYSLTQGLTDVTEGSNSGSTEGEACDGVGFRATAGWDPASGLGSVNYALLKEVLP